MYKLGSQAYEQVNLETCVSQASPHQLIVLLYDGALNAIKLAKLYIQKGNIAGKGLAISKAINIVDNGLKSCLDLEKGGEIAENLERLYHYISQQLVLANLYNDQDKLQNCFDLLNNIAESWREIAK
ncbi:MULTISPECIES: flagellar export chaperone FliS [unclassified Gilliamella]|uniref:flagellar export chaperone FliS n=1 Tax=unclassified Gilliamella TaxID=2685620 RepID=UPI00226AAEA3|nr:MULTISPECIES: flagellar export chaperone FliS [unclassified Gilliamella]MCX8575095.1 flagellar export chaperone FliS [Gilliamella sp. B3831]MCX8577477.1 flagellar export chaperone FliS [Gilliamella sp. B3815]MCX8590779.1 flagellar export chaperone FliS [Gilliamella sp. B3812]MCX8604427.1 flagellar export chaperone FliS [Gilliamella sp. B3823]MCX8605368.1 flagellar export chaperone FliS [Gilliamella sp. B3825]